MDESRISPTVLTHCAKPNEIPLTFVEYFAGIGLFRMGLEETGWRVVFANDWSADRAQLYEGFFGDSYQLRDVFDLKAEEIPQATLATCSFPCIDLSLAGKGKGIDGRHSGAYWGFYNLLKEQGESAPPLVLLENVTGWMYSNGGIDFRITAKSLNDLGYFCDVFLLNALSFVPQSRPRIFMAGVRSVDVLGDGAEVSARSKRLMPQRLKELISDNEDVRWAHLNIPEPPEYLSHGFSGDVVEILQGNDPRWWPEAKVNKHLDMMSQPHLEMVNRLALQKGMTFRTFFRRRRKQGQRAEVRSDDIAGCLRTAVGGSGKQFLVSAGGGRVRMRTLTAREYARLQGVPDSFPIVARTENQSLSAFGDAVCVPVVKWLATNVLRPLTEGPGAFSGEQG